MPNHRKFTEDDYWRQYFRRHFPDLEQKYPPMQRAAQKGWRWLVRNIAQLWKTKQKALCPYCRFNSPSICPHPERPNALECRDYKEKEKDS